MITNYSGNLAYTQVDEYDFLGRINVMHQPDGRAVLLQFADLAIPAGALVRQVRCRVKARAPGFVHLDQAAEFRAAGSDPAASSTEIVVDFKGVRTIASLGEADSDFTSVRTRSDGGFRSRESFTSVDYAVWNGTTFGFLFSLADFGEVATERIKLVFGTAVDPAEIASTWAATLPSPPSHVELTVNSGRVWSGGVATPAGPGSDYDVDAVIDVTAAVAAAVATGAVPVHIELTSIQPADLELTVVEADVLHVFDVGFPEGSGRRVERAEEGAWPLDLPLSGLPGAAVANIHRVDLTVTAEVGSTRVVPSVGPIATLDATVALQPGRTVYLRLPAAMLAPFEELAGFRVALSTAAETELSATVHGPYTPPGGAGTGPPAPGEPLADVIVTPSIVAVGETRWITLLLEQPLELPGHDLWVALTPVRGEAALTTTEATAVDEDDRAMIKWRAASGSFRSLSAPSELPALDAMIRAIGIAPSENPVGSVQLHAATRPDITITADPPASGQQFALDLGTNAVTPTDQDLGAVPAFRLELLTTTPGTYTFDQIRVFYTPEEE